MFLPDSIDLGQSEKYILSIRLTSNSFMFAISDPEEGQNLCLRETSFSSKDDMLGNIQRIIFDLNFLTQEFKQVNIILVSSEYELVPGIYFNSSEKNNLYDISHFKKSEQLLSNINEKEDIVTLFNIERTIYDFLIRSLHNPLFFHHSVLLTKFAQKKCAGLKANNNKMYLNFYNEHLDIMSFTGNHISHCMTLENEPPLNQLYTILKAWEECGYNQLKDTLYIIGEADESLSSNLMEYIKNIESISKPSEIYLWNEDAQNAPIDLLTLLV